VIRACWRLYSDPPFLYCTSDRYPEHWLLVCQLSTLSPETLEDNVQRLQVRRYSCYLLLLLLLLLLSTNAQYHAGQIVRMQSLWSELVQIGLRLKAAGGCSCRSLGADALQLGR